MNVCLLRELLVITISDQLNKACLYLFYFIFLDITSQPADLQELENESLHPDSSECSLCQNYY